MFDAAFTKPCDYSWPFDHKESVSRFTRTKIEKVDTERALLGFFLAKLFKLDPDLLVGHDIAGFDLEVLMHRILVNKIPNWSRIGRLRRANPPQSGKVSSIKFLSFMYDHDGRITQCHQRLGSYAA